MKNVIKSFIEWLVNLLMKCITLSADDVRVLGTKGDPLRNWNNVYGIVNGIWEYIAIFAIGLTLVYFLMEMNQKIALEGRDLNMKSFFAPFLKLMISIAVISQSSSIISIILNFNDQFITAASTLTEQTGVTDQVVKDMITGIEQSLWGAGGIATGLFMLLFVMLIILLIFIVGAILKLAFSWKALMYKIEVLFRVSLIPFAAADVYNGMHSTAIRYFKGFIALGIYGVSLVTLPALASAVLASGATTGIGMIDVILTFGSLLLAPFAAISVSGTIKQVAKEALGA